MNTDIAASRVARCTERMKKQGIDVLVLAKPANMVYLTGDGRLCAFAMITRQGQVALGVPTTDVEDVSRAASYDEMVGFEDEVGMIHSIAHFFGHFGISSGVVGLEFTFVTQSMRAMLTHPHAKPAGVEVKDATPILSSLRMVKEPGEIEAIRRAGNVVARSHLRASSSRGRDRVRGGATACRARVLPWRERASAAARERRRVRRQLRPVPRTVGRAGRGHGGHRKRRPGPVDVLPEGAHALNGA